MQFPKLANLANEIWKWCERRDLDHIHFVKKAPRIDYSKSPLEEIVKIFFDAKLAPLSSILTWRSSAICHLVCS